MKRRSNIFISALFFLAMLAFTSSLGFLKPDAGRVVFAGRDITGRAPQLYARDGMTRTFQIVQPFAAQTVRENIAFVAHLHERSRTAALAQAEEVAARVRLAGQLDKPAADLTVAGRKRLELARALAPRPRLLLLDEVLAELNPQEIAEMIPVVRSRVASGDTTVLMIEHVMQAVMNLAEHVWVLAQGQLIASGTPAEVTTDERVIAVLLCPFPGEGLPGPGPPGQGQVSLLSAGGPETFSGRRVGQGAHAQARWRPNPDFAG